MILYKYIKSSHAQAMIDHGQIRIGTLHEYRNDPNDQRGDNGEGTFNLFSAEKGTTYTRQEDMPAALKRAAWVDDGAQLTITGNVNVNFTTTDVYLYCVTTNPQKDLMEQFGYDACVKITDSDKFNRAVAQHLYKAGFVLPNPIFAECNYGGRKSTEEIGEAIYWRKPPSYVLQAEMRLLLYSAIKLDKLSPLIRAIEEIKPYVQLHKF